MKDVSLQLRIPIDLEDRIEAYRLELANKGGGILSKSEVVRQLIERGLGTRKPGK